MANRVLEPEVLYDDAPSSIDPELELLARWMDSVFEIPGTRIRLGLDPILGLLPGLGDLLTTLVSLYILGAARRYGVPRVTLARMASNVAIDLALGSLPLVGDVFDVFWKSNIKNVALLQRHVRSTPAEQRRARSGDWLFLAGLILLLLVLLAATLAMAYGIIYLFGKALVAATR
ncbi:MAG TPA: DUF4112 domain-containing protein [Pirellulales bacterium]|nr:DUF4112 domain-containing protein [Pirellulales bacterium]